jgi:hypothetical protein
MIPYEAIDCEIRRLVSLVNAFPGIRTVGSCAGHDEGHGREAEIDLVADSQEAVAALIAALPFWGLQGGFVNNQSTTKTIWGTLALNGDGRLTYKLRLSGHPRYAKWLLIGEVENALAAALTRPQGMHPASTIRAPYRTPGN